MEINASEQPIVALSVSVTPKTYYKFFWHWMLRFRKSYFFYLALLLLLFALLVLLALSARGSLSDVIYLAALFPTILLANIPSRYGRHREMYQAETLYGFYEDHLKSRCTVMGTLHYRATPYENYTLAIETKSAFNLLLPARKFMRNANCDYYDPDPYGTSAILAKDQLTAEQQQALRELFARKFGEKFKTSK